MRLTMFIYFIFYCNVITLWTNVLWGFRVQIILKSGSNWAWCSKQIHVEEKVLRIFVRIDACGVWGSKCVNLVVRIETFVLGSIAVPSIWFTFLAHAGSILHVAPNLRQTLTLGKFLRNILCEKRWTWTLVIWAD